MDYVRKYVIKLIFNFRVKAGLVGKMVRMANGKNANFADVIANGGRAGSISYAKAIKGVPWCWFKQISGQTNGLMEMG